MYSKPDIQIGRLRAVKPARPHLLSLNGVLSSATASLTWLRDYRRPIRLADASSLVLKNQAETHATFSRPGKLSTIRSVLCFWAPRLRQIEIALTKTSPNLFSGRPAGRPFFAVGTVRPQPLRIDVRLRRLGRLLDQVGVEARRLFEARNRYAVQRIAAGVVERT